MGRIREEAERSGAPLEEEEQSFLSHLPTTPTNPMAHRAFDPELPAPVHRDFGYERLCNLAKDAHLHDLQTRLVALFTV
jgi:hypothetical protein